MEYNSGLAFTGKHERVHRTERMENEFWDLIIQAMNSRNIPDSYPFNAAASAVLRDNPEEGPSA